MMAKATTKKKGAPAAARKKPSRTAEDPAAGVLFFKTPADLRKWLAKHHATASELWVGFYKKATGVPSITWQEAVDEALCVGWIDGIRKSIDDKRYKNRLTPRRRNSVWSAINIARVAALTREKRMRPEGLAAFEKRRPDKSGIYSYEQRPPDLPEPYRTALQRDPLAHAFFVAQPPGYRKLATWWIVSARKEETRSARLGRLIQTSRAGKRI